MKTMRLSSVFSDGGWIPRRHTADGEDCSPPLSWMLVPEKTRSFALIVDDPDAPFKEWTHWVVYNIPADRRTLSASLPQRESFADGIRQGINDYGKTGWGGPCPPSGTHRYTFRLFALDTMIGEKIQSKEDLLHTLKGHIIAEGTLTGKYRR